MAVLDYNGLTTLVNKIKSTFYVKPSTGIPNSDLEGGITNDKITSLSATKLTDQVPVANGGTGASTAANARSNLGITPANIGAEAKGSITISGTTKTTAYETWTFTTKDGTTLTKNMVVF